MTVYSAPNARRRPIRTRSRLACAISVMAVMMVTASPHAIPVKAAGSVCDAYHGPGYFDGFEYDWRKDPTPQYYEGAAADITSTNSHQCPADPSYNYYNLTAQWVMIANGSSTNYGQGYVQSGFITRAGGVCQRWFSQIAIGNEINPAYQQSECQPADGSTHYYAEVYTPSCLCIRSFVNDGRLLQSTWFNPFNAWTTPFSTNFYGETKYIQSDMPGTAAAPTTFGTTTYPMQAQVYNNSFINQPCNLQGRNDSTTVGPQPPRWGRGANNGCQYFNDPYHNSGQATIWTN